MRNTTVSKIVKVLAKLFRSTAQDMLQPGFFTGIDVRPIIVYRCKHFVRITGRKWLAPLYRPVLGSFSVKPKTFVAVRINGPAVDIEYVDPSTKESIVYTVSQQEWREKSAYFIEMPPERLKGSLGDNVKHIIQLRRSANDRQEVGSGSTRYGSSLGAPEADHPGYYGR